MSLQEVKEGRYSGKITNYGIKFNEYVNKPEVLIQLQFTDDEDKEHFITWKGLFTKKDGSPSQKTIDTLITCGFATNDPSVLAEGPSGGHLDQDKTLDLTLERNDANYLEVTWINEPGGSMFEDTLSKGDAAKQMKGLKLGGAFLQARKAKGEPKAKAESDVGDPPSTDENDEIPF